MVFESAPRQNQKTFTKVLPFPRSKKVVELLSHNNQLKSLFYNFYIVFILNFKLGDATNKLK